MQIIKSPYNMVKKCSLLLLGLLTMFQISTAQVVVDISDASADAGSTLDVDISYSNFSGIISSQYSVAWDTTQFEFNSIQNITSELDQFTASSISTPVQTGDKGVLQISWSKTNTQPESLPNNTRIFTLRLNAIGDPCDNSMVRLSNNPTVIEFADENANNVGATANNGTVMINGTNCSGGDGDLTVIVDDVTVDAGSNRCVAVSVENFVNIQTAEFVLEFDPSIVRYTGFQNANLPDFSSSNLNELNADQGRVALAWFDNTVVNPVTLEGTLIEFCFDAIGGNGQVSPLTIEEQIDFTNSDEESVPFILDDGSFTITGMVDPNAFTLISGDAVINMGQTGCVPISVRNFTDIQSMQFNVRWDENDFIFSSVDALNLEELTQSNVTNIDNTLRVSWSNPTGTSVANNTVIFELCLEATGDCDTSVPIEIVSIGTVSIEVSNTDNEELMVGVVTGNATIECDGCAIAIQALESPSCRGEADGNIRVNLSGSNFNCKWTDSSGATIQESSTECDLLNVEAGTYTLMIDDGADCQESRTFTLEDPGTIIFGGSKVNETDGCDGSINLMMMGGTEPFTFAWDDGSTSDSRTMLCAGEYCVTATDANGCTAETCFTIQEGGPVSCGVDITNVRCNGENDGEIDLCIEGGTGPYTVAWSGPSGEFNTEDISGLMAGTYNYTITDSSTPALSSQGSVVVEEPDAITVSSTTVPADPNMENGSIDLSVSGGTAPYTFLWTPGGSTQEDPGNLGANTYTVIVTDENNCSAMFDITVPSNGINPDLEILSASCNNVCDGSIDGTVTGGTGPYTFALDGTAVTFPVTELCPGEYEFVVTDANGDSESRTITIANPDPLEVAVDMVVNCTEGEANGSISVEVSGGTAPYEYNWNRSGDSPRIDGLRGGSYNVVVTDARGCTATLAQAVQLECGDGPCGNARSIISPNGDNLNDEFVIMCATDFPNRLIVFDRWGRTVYSQESYDNTWTGTDENGEELADGGYLWVLEVTNGDGSRDLWKGSVTIVRDQF